MRRVQELERNQRIGFLDNEVDMEDLEASMNWNKLTSLYRVEWKCRGILRRRRRELGGETEE